MTGHEQPAFEISASVLLKAYTCGIFPMAESADSPELHWIDPEHRGALPLDGIRLPRRLAKTIRQGRFDVRIDQDFEAVIDGCAASRTGRTSTWINDRIRALYGELFSAGHCHTVEVYRDGGLVGGLYGVGLQGAFFGESMFSTETDASKVALINLCARLIHGGFTLLDTQFVTEHLAQFGVEEISRATFHRRLTRALATDADFMALDVATPPDRIVEIVRRAAG
ncbi:MAG: leucyl/phenylalanyl-tRNA--protein transferase [Hyphomicrobiaceae bacterium]